jgi:hypothetical protein
MYDNKDQRIRYQVRNFFDWIRRLSIFNYLLNSKYKLG